MPCKPRHPSLSPRTHAKAEKPDEVALASIIPVHILEMTSRDQALSIASRTSLPGLPREGGLKSRNRGRPYTTCDTVCPCSPWESRILKTMTPTPFAEVLDQPPTLPSLRVWEFSLSEMTVKCFRILGRHATQEVPFLKKRPNLRLPSTQFDPGGQPHGHAHQQTSQ